MARQAMESVGGHFLNLPSYSSLILPMKLLLPSSASSKCRIASEPEFGLRLAPIWRSSQIRSWRGMGEIRSAPDLGATPISA